MQKKDAPQSTSRSAFLDLAVQSKQIKTTDRSRNVILRVGKIITKTYP